MPVLDAPKVSRQPLAPTNLGAYIRQQLIRQGSSVRDLRNPTRWAHERLNTFLWSKQRDILNSIVRHPKTTVRSAHDTGKSFTAAVATTWWLSVHPIGSAFVITSAPTAAQVEVILWREIQKAKTRGKLPGRITTGTIPKWKDDTGEIIAYGRKPADLASDASGQAFQGVHARYVLIILDEACGIPPWLWESIHTIATNKYARILAIGNPDVPDTDFHKTHKPEQSHIWNQIKISAFDTPAFTDEDVPDSLLLDLVDPAWVDQRADDWGRESPLYMSKVNAEFPEVNEETLIHPRLIQDAQLRDLSSSAFGEPGTFGLDVARFGRNETAMYRNRGGHLRLEWNATKQDTMRTAGKAARLLNETFGNAPMHIDTVGVGAGVFDRLAEQGFPVVPFVASEAPSTPVNQKRFVNRRAEQWWNFRMMLEKGMIDLPQTNEDPKLISQLASIRYFIRSDGRIIVESKDDAEDRGMPSPDRADAAMMACADPLPTQGDFWIPPKPQQRAAENPTYTADNAIQAVISLNEGGPTVDLASITADLLKKTW
jgi:hypothetical protein